MKDTKKFHLILRSIVILGILIGFFSLFKNTSKTTKDTGSVDAQQTAQPLFMVPGTGGDFDRFDDLIAQLKKSYTDLAVAKIQVNTDNSLKIKGQINKDSQHQVVVVAFEDASDAALAKQDAWFQKALQFVQKKYQFTDFDYLGFSNGGLIITQYLEKSSAATDPKLDNLITLGTPYNDVSWEYNEAAADFSTLKAVSDQMSGYLAAKEKIPSNIKMYNVVGQHQDETSDGVVPVTSVLAARLLYGDADTYREIIVNEDAQHSELVCNKEVQTLLTETIW